MGANGRPREYDYDEIVRLWLDGNSMKRVAEIVGCSQPTVREALKTEGFDPSRPGKRCDPAVVSEALRYHEANPDVPLAQVTDMFGLNRTTLRNRLRYGPLKGRVYETKFDRDECRALYAQGMNQTELARHYGVTHRAVGVVLRADDEHTCGVCGVPIDIGSQFCRVHVGSDKIKRGPGDTLWCHDCKQFKPEQDFYTSPGRPNRGHKGRCKQCDNVDRTARRRARGEAQREYEREYRRRRRAVGLR